MPGFTAKDWETKDFLNYIRNLYAAQYARLTGTPEERASTEFTGETIAPLPPEFYAVKKGMQRFLSPRALQDYKAALEEQEAKAATQKVEHEKVQYHRQLKAIDKDARQYAEKYGLPKKIKPENIINVNGKQYTWNYQSQEYKNNRADELLQNTYAGQPQDFPRWVKRGIVVPLSDLTHDKLYNIKRVSDLAEMYVDHPEYEKFDPKTFDAVTTANPQNPLPDVKDAPEIKGYNEVILDKIRHTHPDVYGEMTDIHRRGVHGTTDINAKIRHLIGMPLAPPQTNIGKAGAALFGTPSTAIPGTAPSVGTTPIASRVQAFAQAVPQPARPGAPQAAVALPSMAQPVGALPAPLPQRELSLEHAKPHDVRRLKEAFYRLPQETRDDLIQSVHRQPHEGENEYIFRLSQEALNPNVVDISSSMTQELTHALNSIESPHVVHERNRPLDLEQEEDRTPATVALQRAAAHDIPLSQQPYFDESRAGNLAERPEYLATMNSPVFQNMIKDLRDQSAEHFSANILPQIHSSLARSGIQGGPIAREMLQSAALKHQKQLDQAEHELAWKMHHEGLGHAKSGREHVGHLGEMVGAGIHQQVHNSQQQAMQHNQNKLTQQIQDLTALQSLGNAGTAEQAQKQLQYSQAAARFSERQKREANSLQNLAGLAGEQPNMVATTEQGMDVPKTVNPYMIPTAILTAAIPKPPNPIGQQARGGSVRARAQGGALPAAQPQAQATPPLDPNAMFQNSPEYQQMQDMMRRHQEAQNYDPRWEYARQIGISIGSHKPIGEALAKADEITADRMKYHQGQERAIVEKMMAQRHDHLSLAIDMDKTRQEMAVRHRDAAVHERNAGVNEGRLDLDRMKAEDLKTYRTAQMAAKANAPKKWDTSDHATYKQWLEEMPLLEELEKTTNRILDTLGEGEEKEEGVDTGGSLRAYLSEGALNNTDVQARIAGNPKLKAKYDQLKADLNQVPLLLAPLRTKGGRAGAMANKQQAAAKPDLSMERAAVVKIIKAANDGAKSVLDYDRFGKMAGAHNVEPKVVPKLYEVYSETKKADPKTSYSKFLRSFGEVNVDEGEDGSEISQSFVPIHESPFEGHKESHVDLNKIPRDLREAFVAGKISEAEFKQQAGLS